jgi:transcriptional regulator with XRE-family HTH domain
MAWMRFPDKLDRLIARCGKSQSAIARETGIGQSAISAMTRGSRRPFMDQALRLARAVGTSLDYLADDAQDEPPQSSGLPEDERAVVKLYRALGLDEAEALRRLSAPLGQPWDPGPVRDQSSLITQELARAREVRKPAPKPPDPVQDRMRGKPKRKP